MKTYIALFRGINVGGRNILPMKELRALLENLGARGVKTYIQSGNAVFQYDTESVSKLSVKITATIQKRYGFEPHVFLLDLAGMEKAVAMNPFPNAESEPKTVHLFFLATAADNPDMNKLDALKRQCERFELIENVFYLYLPEGVGRSKLATQVEKALGVPVTARNWRSVDKILAIAKNCS